MQQEDDEFFDSEEFLDTLNLYEQTIAAGNSPYMDTDDLLDVAEFYLSKGEFSKAQEAMELALELHPKAQEPVAMMADIMFDSQNWEQAVVWLNKVLDNDTFNVRAWQNLADSQLHLNLLPEALETAEYCLAIKPGFAPALMQKAYIKSRTEQYEEAHELYQRYLQLQPDDDVALYQAAFNLCMMDDKLEEANKLLIRAEEVSAGMSPEQINICLQRSYTEARLGHMEEALAALERSKEFKDDDIPVDYNLLTGHVYLLFNQQQKASEYFSEALRTSQDPINTLRSMAQIHMDCNHHDSALECFKCLEMLAQNTDDAKLKDDILAAIAPQMAYCYFIEHDEKNCLNYLKKAIATNPQDTKQVFEDVFPEGARLEDYVTYALRAFFGSPS